MAALRILITGAGELIGGEIAARLAARGHRVSGLVHRNPQVRGNDGYMPPPYRVYHGDVSLPGFGLDAADTADHDLLIHCAATTRFDLEDEDYRAVNVAGTAHAIELAQASDMALLHISTAYVCGKYGGLVREDDPLRQNGFANGYEATNAHGEALVAASSLHHAIARPSAWWWAKARVGRFARSTRSMPRSR